MSDRIAVFNEGRIEQVATPAELYEQPATGFVAGFVGTSNLLDGPAAQAVLGEPGHFSVRPEKIHLHIAADAPPAEPGEVRAAGHVVDVVYLGSATHSVVELDAAPGTRLTVMQQNLESSLDHALSRRGEAVALTWQRAHVVSLARSASVEGADSRPTHLEETR